MQSHRPKDVGFADAVSDPDTRGEFIRRKTQSSSLLTYIHNGLACRSSGVACSGKRFHESDCRINI